MGGNIARRARLQSWQTVGTLHASTCIARRSPCVIFMADIPEADGSVVSPMMCRLSIFAPFLTPVEKYRCRCSPQYIGQLNAHRPARKLLMIYPAQLLGASIRTPYFAAIVATFATSGLCLHRAAALGRRTTPCRKAWQGVDRGGRNCGLHHSRAPCRRLNGAAMSGWSRE